MLLDIFRIILLSIQQSTKILKNLTIKNQNNECTLFTQVLKLNSLIRLILILYTYRYLVSRRFIYLFFQSTNQVEIDRLICVCP